MKKVILAALLLTACTKGTHVTTSQRYIMMYQCEYRSGWFTTDRTVALCDKIEECNKICAEYKP